MKPKKLIEVAMPIKEISAESVRDKSIRHGHISTLHLWWARRPLPVCRAVVFASLVPDPLDENCPQAFKDAVASLLKGSLYKPYDDIPYTFVIDRMDDNLRHRLMMFIGKFSNKCQANMIAGKSTSPADQLAEGSLIKWENKNNEAKKIEVVYDKAPLSKRLLSHFFDISIWLLTTLIFFTIIFRIICSYCFRNNPICSSCWNILSNFSIFF